MMIIIFMIEEYSEKSQNQLDQNEFKLESFNRFGPNWSWSRPVFTFTFDTVDIQTGYFLFCGAVSWALLDVYLWTLATNANSSSLRLWWQPKTSTNMVKPLGVRGQGELHPVENHWCSYGICSWYVLLFSSELEASCTLGTCCKILRKLTFLFSSL